MRLACALNPLKPALTNFPFSIVCRDPSQLLRLLVAAGCPPALPRTHRLMGMRDPPLQVACWAGYGPEAVTALLEAGADPVALDAHQMCPLVMAGNQGNWRELQAIFTARPQLRECCAVPCCAVVGTCACTDLAWPGAAVRRAC